MQLGRCPVCHSRINLEQLCQDESGRQLLALLAGLDTATGTALVSYIGLFRSANRDLANDRALRLVRETLALEAAQWLTPALQMTVESIRLKRETSQAKVLANHNYLKRVLEGVIADGVTQTAEIAAPKTTINDYRSAAASAERVRDTDW